MTKRRFLGIGRSSWKSKRLERFRKILRRHQKEEGQKNILAFPLVPQWCRLFGSVSDGRETRPGGAIGVVVASPPPAAMTSTPALMIVPSKYVLLLTGLDLKDDLQRRSASHLLQPSTVRPMLNLACGYVKSRPDLGLARRPILMPLMGMRKRE